MMMNDEGYDENISIYRDRVWVIMNRELAETIIFEEENKIIPENQKGSIANENDSNSIIEWFSKTLWSLGNVSSTLRWIYWRK